MYNVCLLLQYFFLTICELIEPQNLRLLRRHDAIFNKNLAFLSFIFWDVVLFFHALIINTYIKLKFFVILN
ncbi:hypothetical protein L1887_33002 [Cichorium endivia]|nr:hypothetical protein L1887_33002 [Cichorium endivia]